MSQYEHLQPEASGWSKWSYFPRFWKHQCCECGAKHLVLMKLDKRYRIWMKWKTDNRGKR